MFKNTDYKAVKVITKDLFQIQIRVLLIPGNPKNIRIYKISMARTKKVVTKGRSSVSQGQCVAMAIKRAAVEIKNNSQYKPFRFLFTSM